MNEYVAIAFLAVLLKLILWFKSRKYEWAKGSWYFLVSAFLIQNCVELVGYHQVSKQIAPANLLNTYYITLLVLLVSIIGFVHRSSSVTQVITTKLCFFVCGIFCLLILFGDTVIVGNYDGIFPVKAIKGEYFYLYLIFGLTCISLSLGFISSNIRASIDNERRMHFYNLVSLAPFFLVALVVGGGLLIGLKINGSGLFPIASSLFMFLTVILRCKPDYEIQGAIPFTKANRLSKLASLSALQGAHGSLTLKESLDAQEALLIGYAIQLMGKNKSQVSEYLGVDRRTLDRKLKKHNMWWRA